jgi:hypothetical protein
VGGGPKGLVFRVDTIPCVRKGFLNITSCDEEGWVG